MKILLFSDSHGYTHNMIKVINNCKDIDTIIHLGDFIKDAIKLSELYKHIPCEFVPGNNDWTKDYPGEKVLNLDGKKILITHGHLYNVKYDYEKIILRGKALRADAVFFGHTHKVEELYSEGMLVLNPGSISIPSQSEQPTYCLVEIKEGKISVRFGSPK
jgi:putative phosphoesterase